MGHQILPGNSRDFYLHARPTTHRGLVTSSHQGYLLPGPRGWIGRFVHLRGTRTLI
jgi:hypothetical protein